MTVPDALTLAITSLAGLGDGVATYEGARVFVPYTLPGDVVEAQVVKRTKEAWFAELVRIVEPSPDRIAPPCPHFGSCGGCALQHLNDTAYAAFKQRSVTEAVSRAGFDPALVAPLVRVPAASRRRVTLHVTGRGVGYHAARSHRVVAVETCEILSPRLAALLARLPEAMATLPKSALPESLHLTDADTGVDVVAQAERPLTPAILAAWAMLGETLGMARVSWRAKERIEPVASFRAVQVDMGDAPVDLPPGAFLQASREGQAALVAEALETTRGAKRMADLFAGLGTFSLPLARVGHVLALEGEARAVEAMRAAAKRAGLATLDGQMRDLFRDPLSAVELRGFDAVVIDPPRAGAKAQIVELARSGVPTLCLISCNPATFGRDAAALREGGYRLTRAVGIDQFVWSAHVEMVGVFTRSSR